MRQPSQSSGVRIGEGRESAHKVNHRVLLLSMRHMPAPLEDVQFGGSTGVSADELRETDGAVFVAVPVYDEDRRLHEGEVGCQTPGGELRGEPNLRPRIQHPLRLL